MSALPHENQRNQSPRLGSSIFCSGDKTPLRSMTAPAGRHSTLTTLGVGGGNHSRGGCPNRLRTLTSSQLLVALVLCQNLAVSVSERPFVSIACAASSKSTPN